jgi:hypothetical protein
MTTLTQRIDAALIEAGHDPECVQWVCANHHRHCVRINTPHAEHTCYWCDAEAPAQTDRP